jgi:thiamine biosynthesis lipoprotein
MATTFEILLPYGTPTALPASCSALDLIDQLEERLSVYRPDSELSQINRLAGAGQVPVEADLFELLQQAARLTVETQGAFDITAGPLIKAWGFYQRRQRIPSARQRAEVLRRVGMHKVLLDADKRRVRFDVPGVEMNLGSIGKGYALDRAAELLRQDWGLWSALLHAGHSSVYALGTPPDDIRGWPVGICHPWDAKRRLAVLRLRDQALGTSAATYQHLVYCGRKLGHILDPRTGWPAEGIASASVIAPTAAQADALATAFFILGVASAEHYCASHPDVGAVLLPAGEDPSPVFFGLAADTVSLHQ